jgi:hypothetical protein
VRERLASRGLQPPPLYPRERPARVADADTALRVVGSRFTVTWTRRVPSGPYAPGYLTFGRDKRSILSRDLKSVRLRGFKPYRVRIDGREVWRLCGHVCGYEWREDGCTYTAFGTYYVRAGGDQADLRAVLRVLAPLRP